MTRWWTPRLQILWLQLQKRTQPWWKSSAWFLLTVSAWMPVMSWNLYFHARDAHVIFFMLPSANDKLAFTRKNWGSVKKMWAQNSLALGRMTCQIKRALHKVFLNLHTGVKIGNIETLNGGFYQGDLTKHGCGSFLKQLDQAHYYRRAWLLDMYV